MSLKLYGYWRSSASWRVRWACNLRSISLEHFYVNLKEGRQKEEAFLKVNPAGLVPYLDLGDGSGLSQSLAQILYVNEQPEAQGVSLLSSELFVRAKQFELWEIIAADTHPVQNLSVQQYFSEDPEKQAAWARHFIERGLQNYSAACRNVSGQFSIGHSVSLPDLALIPQIYNAIRFKVKVEESFPSLWKIYQHSLSTAECFQAAPEQQADCS